MIDAATRAMVWRRAGRRCEYCRVHQDDFDFFTFHIEHIIPRQHGGSDSSTNLCLACRECNSSKGTNLAGLLEGKIVPLFHPRRQVWKRHFRWEGGLLVGKTRAGKVAVQVLNMNDPARVIVRLNLRIEGRFPPPEK
jgi:HNH endonuclease